MHCFKKDMKNSQEMATEDNAIYYNRRGEISEIFDKSSKLTYICLPLTRGQPSYRPVLSFPKGGRIRGVPLYSSIVVQTISRRLQTPQTTPGDRLCNMIICGRKGDRANSQLSE